MADDGSLRAMNEAAPVGDLGVLNGPVLVFGGPYSNLEATQALLAEAQRLGIPPERTICSGDVAAYCADPQATVDLIREAGLPVLMGNCEEAFGTDSEDCGCGFVEGSACDRLSARWMAYARAELDTGAKAWMATLPRRLHFTLGERRLAVVHGAASRINRFLFASSPQADLAEEIALTGTDGVIAGHSGLPFTRIVDGHLWHNAGAVGLPANDGTTRAWYGLLTPVEGGIRVTHHPLAYDYRTAARKMRQRGLPAPYALALETGLWPDCDILPAAERAMRGWPLSFRPLLWRNDRPAKEVESGVAA